MEENILKKFTLICCFVILTLALFGCGTGSKTKYKEKYSLNGLVAYGAVDNNNTDKTEITYEVVISGNEDDINNIDAQEPLINMEYIDLMLENGPHNSQKGCKKSIHRN